MPFGLCNAGPTYQRLMDICLSGLPASRIVAYLDDIVVFSRSFSEHLQDLSVFQRLSAAKINLRPEKCVIASSEFFLLGYHLSTQGIKPQEQLVEAILKFSRPTTKKQVKRFLGTVSFYRNSIDRFADITEATLFHWDDWVASLRFFT